MTPPPTIRQLIEAMQDGVMNTAQGTLLVNDPVAYAAKLGIWQFNTPDKRIDKFKAMSTEGFALAHKNYLLVNGSNAVAARELAGDYAKVMCAASKIVDWSRPSGATDDSYLDQIAQ